MAFTISFSCMTEFFTPNAGLCHSSRGLLHSKPRIPPSSVTIRTSFIFSLQRDAGAVSLLFSKNHSFIMNDSFILNDSFKRSESVSDGRSDGQEASFQTDK